MHTEDLKDPVDKLLQRCPEGSSYNEPLVESPMSLPDRDIGLSTKCAEKQG
jgi:hypothetical protein